MFQRNKKHQFYKNLTPAQGQVIERVERIDLDLDASLHGTEANRPPGLEFGRKKLEKSLSNSLISNRVKVRITGVKLGGGR